MASGGAAASAQTADDPFPPSVPLTTQPQPAPMTPPPPRPAAIEMERLAPLNPWNVSGIGRGERAAARTVWRYSGSDDVSALLDAVPTAPTGPAATTLLRTLLASPTEPPTGDNRLAARKRVEALARLGAAADVIELSVGPMREDMSVAMFAAQAELALGRFDPACRRIDAIAEDDAPPFVLRMRAVCFAVKGDGDAASLAMEVANTKGAGDPWLASALRVMAGQAPTGPRAQLPTARYDTSINAAVSLAAGLAPPADASVATASQFALRAVAASDQTPAAVRAQAAIRLARLNRIAPDAARSAIEAAIDPRARTQPAWVMLARTLQNAADAAAQANALRAAIDQAGPAADAAALFRLYRMEIAALASDPNQLVGAASFARAALAAGDVATARVWREKADRSRSDPRVVAALDAAFAAGGFASGDDARFAAERRADAGGPTARRDVLALAALGLPVQGGAEALMLQPPPAPAPARAPAPQSAAAAERSMRVALLQQAGARGAAGEVALLAGVLLADGAQSLAPDDLQTVLKGLRDAGFEADARAAAMEAILAIAPAAPTASGRR